MDTVYWLCIAGLVASIIIGLIIFSILGQIEGIKRHIQYFVYAGEITHDPPYGTKTEIVEEVQARLVSNPDSKSSPSRQEVREIFDGVCELFGEMSVPQVINQAVIFRRWGVEKFPERSDGVTENTST